MGNCSPKLKFLIKNKKNDDFSKNGKIIRMQMISPIHHSIEMLDTITINELLKYSLDILDYDIVFSNYLYKNNNKIYIHPHIVFSDNKCKKNDILRDIGMCDECEYELKFESIGILKIKNKEY
jgi:hypothetical protein